MWGAGPAWPGQRPEKVGNGMCSLRGWSDRQRLQPESLVNCYLCPVSPSWALRPHCVLGMVISLEHGGQKFWEPQKSGPELKWGRGAETAARREGQGACPPQCTCAPRQRLFLPGKAQLLLTGVLGGFPLVSMETLGRASATQSTRLG